MVHQRPTSERRYAAHSRRACTCDPGLADPLRQRGQLRVDQARGRGVPVGVGLGAGGREAAADEVGEPEPEVLDAGVHPGQPLLEALGPGRGVGGSGALSVAARAGLAARSARWRGPLVGERRDLAGLVDHALGPQHQQGEGVLAGELPARARAPVGGTDEVDAHLVGRLAAALALAPHEHVAAAGLAPRPGDGELARGRQRGRVRRDLGHLAGGPSGHGAAIKPPDADTDGRNERPDRAPVAV